MSTVLVTVAGPGRRLDVAVPGGVPVAELLPRLVEALAGPLPAERQGEPPQRSPDAGARRNGGGAAARWSLRLRDGDDLPADQSLDACGVVSGDVLDLVERAREDADGSAAARRAPLGAREAGQPQPLPLGERLRLAAGAFARADRWWPGAAPVRGGGRPGRLERARQAWRATEYERLLEGAIATPTLERCAIVGVVSALPGVGRTVTAALLASAFARARGGRTVAVDVSGAEGRPTLTMALAGRPEVSVGDLLGVLDHPTLTRRELRACLADAGDGLALVPAPDAATRLGVHAWTRLLRCLAHHATVVVVDCGHGLQDPGARAALAVADQLVQVVTPGLPEPDQIAADVLAELARPVVVAVGHPAPVEAYAGVQGASRAPQAALAPVGVPAPGEPATTGGWPLPAPGQQEATGGWPAPPPGRQPAAGGAGPRSATARRRASGGGEALDVGALLGQLPEARGAVLLPREPPLPASRGPSRLAWDQVGPAWRRQARELAVLLVADWPALGLVAGPPTP